MSAWYQIPTRHPVPVLCGLALLLLVSVASLPATRADFSLEAFYPRGTPEVDLYRRQERLFGADDTLAVISLEGADVLGIRGYDWVWRLSRRLEGVAGVTGVASPSTLVDAELGDDAPRSNPASVARGQLAQALGRVRARLRERPRTVAPVLREPGSAGLIRVAWALPREAGAPGPERRPAVDAAREVLAIVRSTPPPPGLHARILGMPVVQVLYGELLERDAARHYPLALGVVVVALWLCLGRAVPVAAALALVIVAVVATVALANLAGLVLTVLTLSAPALTGIVGVADSVRILHHYAEESTRSRPGREALESVLSRVGRPCLFSTVTTVAGFASLAASDVAPIREYGLLVAASTTLEFLIVVLGLPALLVVLPGAGPGPVGGPWAAAGGAIGRAVGGRPVAVAAAWGVATVALSLVATRLDLNVKVFSNVSPTGDLARDIEFFERHFGGVLELSCVVEGPRPGHFESPESLRRLDALGRRLAALGLANVASVADYVIAVEAAATPSAGPGGIPGSADDVREALDLAPALGPATLAPLLTPDRSTARIFATIADLGSVPTRELLAKVGAASRECLAGGERAFVTGPAVLAHHTTDHVVSNAMRSFLPAFAAVTLLVGVALGSWRRMVLSVWPNLVGLLAAAGTMVVVGIPVGLTSILVLSVTYGIVVDNTIHLFWRSASLVASAGRRAPLLALESCAPAMIAQGVAMAAGFLVLTGSGFGSNATFGLLAGVTILVGLAADLTLSPALLLLATARQWMPPGPPPGEPHHGQRPLRTGDPPHPPT